MHSPSTPTSAVTGTLIISAMASCTPAETRLASRWITSPTP